MPPLTAHPLWTRIYAASSTVAETTANVIAYARQYAVAAVAQRSKEREASYRSVFRFEEVEEIAAPAGIDIVSVADADVPPDASFADHLTRCAKKVFRTPSLRRDQPSAVERIIFDEHTDGKLMLCVRTGGGKTLTMYLTAVSVGGITLVIIPLLSLTANQLERIKRSMQKEGAVVAVHLDDASMQDVKESVIPAMNEFPHNSSTTMMILCSPQFIANNIHFRNALLRARDRAVLRLIVIDEVHIFAMHGRSFRDSIRVLKRTLFAKLYGSIRGYSPLFLVMTATMPLSLIAVLEDLTFVKWSRPCHQLRSTAADFQQRYIDMDFRVQADVSNLGLSNLIQTLEESSTSHACVFVNFKSECTKWADVLESKIADKLLDVDVVQVNGDQDKHEKFAFTRLFTDSIKMKDYHLCVLVATAAANTGIDQVLVKWVLSVGLPRCLTTLMQERGRNRSQGLYLVLTDWKLFIKLLLSIVVPHELDAEETPVHAFANSMIMSRSPEKRNNQTRDDIPATLAPQTTAEKRYATVQAYTDLIDVVNFLFK